jgi:ribosomal protein L32E
VVGGRWWRGALGAAADVAACLPARRKFKGMASMPNCGYGTNKKDKHVLPNGFRKFVVNNVSDLELLMMHNR